MTLPVPLCPVCRHALGSERVTCSTCETPVHAECHREVGGCVRFACPEAATPRSRLRKALSAHYMGRALNGACMAIMGAVLGMGFHGLGASGEAIATAALAITAGLGFALSNLRTVWQLGSRTLTVAHYARLLADASMLSRALSVTPPAPSRINQACSVTVYAIIAAGLLRFMMMKPILAPLVLVLLFAYRIVDSRFRGRFQDSGWMLDAWATELRELVARGGDTPLAQIEAMPKGKTPVAETEARESDS